VVSDGKVEEEGFASDVGAGVTRAGAREAPELL
jgi:hypothetical protein